MRILLVDDERPFAGAVRRGLEAEGFVVELATDGNEGLAGQRAVLRPRPACPLAVVSSPPLVRPAAAPHPGHPGTTSGWDRAAYPRGGAIGEASAAPRRRQ
jgi:hypothetical protein